MSRVNSLRSRQRKQLRKTIQASIVSTVLGAFMDSIRLRALMATPIRKDDPDAAMDKAAAIIGHIHESVDRMHHTLFSERLKRANTGQVVIL